ncbi:interleukin-1 receptor type 2-like [Pholidichthys leucotaenia]
MLGLLFAVIVIKCVFGRPPLPPLPVKDGCDRVDPEVAIFRVEGEAVILHFPIFMRVLKVRNIAPPGANYLISKANGTEGTTYEGKGRVQHQNKQLWFLPAEASDSGEYTCTYRNGSYCVTGSITLQVYEPTSIDMRKLSIPIATTVGEELNFMCPLLDCFNVTDNQIEWYKGSNSTALHLSRAGSSHQDKSRLTIPAVKRSHAGAFFTCRLKVSINNQLYKVSRTVQIKVQGPDPDRSLTTTTSEPGLIISNTPIIRRPMIVSPLNGTIFESSHGSGLELSCEVVTDCQVVESTEVTWLVNGQSVESSYLDRRAVQGGRRITRVSTDCHVELRLVITVITEEDVKTEIKCVAQNKGGKQEVVTLIQLEDSTFPWVVVAAVAMTCFLTVVSIFLYVLLKPKRKKNMDYFLARQNSTF